MKITKKARAAIRDAIYEAVDEVQDKYIKDIGNRPPEDWSDEETRLFDLIGEVEFKVSTKIDKALSQP